MSGKCDEELVEGALDQALARRRPAPQGSCITVIEAVNILHEQIVTV